MFGMSIIESVVIAVIMAPIILMAAAVAGIIIFSTYVCVLYIKGRLAQHQKHIGKQESWQAG